MSWGRLCFEGSRQQYVRHLARLLAHDPDPHGTRQLPPPSPHSRRPGRRRRGARAHLLGQGAVSEPLRRALPAARRAASGEAGCGTRAAGWLRSAPAARAHAAQYGGGQSAPRLAPTLNLTVPAACNLGSWAAAAARAFADGFGGGAAGKFGKSYRRIAFAAGRMMRSNSARRPPGCRSLRPWLSLLAAVFTSTFVGFLPDKGRAPLYPDH